MFEDLTARLEGIFKGLRGRGVLSEEDVRESAREIRRALLEADVHYKVAKDFVQKIETRAVGAEILKGLNPGQQVVRIVHDQLVELLGGTSSAPVLTGTPPVPASAPELPDAVWSFEQAVKAKAAHTNATPSPRRRFMDRSTPRARR